MQIFYRILIHIFSAAALALTAAVLAAKFRSVSPGPPVSPAPRRRLLRIFGCAAGAAILSRAALLGFCAVFADPDGFSSLVGLWNHWDGPHYMDIARYGYVDDRSGDQWLFIVFFPLYPWLTSLVARLGVSVETAGMAVSWVSLAGAACVLYLLTLADGTPADARRAVKYMLIFPVTVFLGAQYTESLFLLLSVSCLYALRKKRWALAGAMGFLAALTRNLGALLALPFVIEFLADRGLIGPGWPRQWRALRFSRVRAGLWIGLIPLGTLVYLGINQAVYGDPLMFLTIQSDHWNQHLDYFANVLYRTFYHAQTDGNTSTALYLWLFQTVTMALVLGTMPFWVRRLRLSWGVYAVAYVTLSFSASMLLSAARYAMGLAVLYPALAGMTRNRWADAVVTAVFLALALLMARGFALYRMVL